MRRIRRTSGGRAVGVAMTLAGLAGLVACTDSSAEGLDAEERARTVEIGSGAANTLAGTLIGRLSAALEEGGPAHAVDFC